MSSLLFCIVHVALTGICVGLMFVEVNSYGLFGIMFNGYMAFAHYLKFIDEDAVKRISDD